MQTYLVKLKNKKEIARGTMAFDFEKPNGFEFEPGQHIGLVLTDGHKRQGHTLSLVCAPHEDVLTVVTRIRPESEYKTRLNKLQPGDEVEISEAVGRMTLPINSTEVLVFLAGGIGITPFMSMIRHVVKEKLNFQVDLFYSNRKPEATAFMTELLRLAETNDKLRVVLTMTGKNIAVWSGETGYINEKFIRQYLPQLVLSATMFYFAGPPGFAAAMAGLTANLGLPPEKVRSEEFSGY